MPRLTPTVGRRRVAPTSGGGTGGTARPLAPEVTLRHRRNVPAHSARVAPSVSQNNGGGPR